MKRHTATDERCWEYRKAQGNLGAHAPECYDVRVVEQPDHKLRSGVRRVEVIGLPQS